MINGLNKLNQTFTQRILQANQAKLNKSYEKLSSGLRINSASDDAAGMGLLKRLNSQISGDQQAMYNVQDTYSVAQIAEGGMSTIGDMQQRLRDLSVQAANGTLTDADRNLLQEEANQIVSEIDRMSDTVEFNGQKLLNGDYAAGTDALTTQAGADAGETIDVNIEKMDSTGLGLDGFDISTQAAAEASIQTVDDSISTVSSQRAKLGAYQNRLSSTMNFLGIQQENQMAAASVIGDTDYAKEMINKTSLEMLTNVNTSMLVQGNLIGKNVLSLIQ